MRRFIIATVVAIAAMIVFAPARPAAAIEYPWCAQYSGGEDGGGGRNCGFVSFEQCMQTVRGMGGSCERNLFYEGQPAAPPRKQKRHDS